MLMPLQARWVQRFKRNCKEASIQLSKKQTEDEESSKKDTDKEILFGCTGTIGEKISN